MCCDNYYVCNYLFVVMKSLSKLYLWVIIIFLHNSIHVQSIIIKFIGIRVSKICCGIAQLGDGDATRFTIGDVATSPPNHRKTFVFSSKKRILEQWTTQHPTMLSSIQGYMWYPKNIVSLLHKGFTYLYCTYQHYFLSMENTHNTSSISHPTRQYIPCPPNLHASTLS